ncbi:MAG: tRNA lysidine(34) synthetase TilS, partial [Alphaproteobacteria bacterium]|nr:tRNA lysidine(34) synthetase TilS [Alphaproteobacteria bacterium]
MPARRSISSRSATPRRRRHCASAPIANAPLLPAGDPGAPSPSGPLTAAGLGEALAPLGPFERAPVVAVGCSGGADSLALTLLADRWARGLGGRLVALTVDHGLRPESAAEARQVGAWLTAHGIAHRTLRWRGEKPRSNHQARARAARLALLADWCRRHGVLHVLLAHQREDQAETLLLRLGRGSGVSGLAAMAPVREAAGVRFLRPLLAVPRVRLEATLTALRQPWLSDPSNDMTAYARTTARALLPRLEALGASPRRLAATATRLG